MSCLDKLNTGNQTSAGLNADSVIAGLVVSTIVTRGGKTRTCDTISRPKPIITIDCPTLAFATYFKCERQLSTWFSFYWHPELIFSLLRSRIVSVLLIGHRPAASVTYLFWRRWYVRIINSAQLKIWILMRAHDMQGGICVGCKPVGLQVGGRMYFRCLVGMVNFKPVCEKARSVMG